MRKLLFLSILAVLFIGCSRVEYEKSESQAITVTIDSDEGQTVMTIDEDSGNLTSASFVNSETGSTLTKEYSYSTSRNSSELRSVTVQDSVNGSYVIMYGDVVENSSRSLIPEQTEVPAKVQKITRIYTDSERTTRSYESSTPDVIEYQYDENGALKGIFRIDDKNNVICKGAE